MLNGSPPDNSRGVVYKESQLLVQLPIFCGDRILEDTNSFPTGSPAVLSSRAGELLTCSASKLHHDQILGDTDWSLSWSVQVVFTRKGSEFLVQLPNYHLCQIS